MNEKGQGNLEAFQVSDQAVKLAQQNTFLPSDDPAKCRFRQPVYVEGAETTIADYHFFLVTVCLVSAKYQPPLNFVSRYLWNQKTKDYWGQTFLLKTENVHSLGQISRST